MPTASWPYSVLFLPLTLLSLPLPWVTGSSDCGHKHLVSVEETKAQGCSWSEELSGILPDLDGTRR